MGLFATNSPTHHWGSPNTQAGHCQTHHLSGNIFMVTWCSFRIAAISYWWRFCDSGNWMCSSGSAVTFTCAGHCLPISDKFGGCSPKLLRCQLRHRKRDLHTFWYCFSSLLPPLLNAYHCFPAFFTVLCGYSFHLTSAYLWTKLLMAFSSLRHDRWWQSKWAQGLGASSSKYCLHLEPDTKVTVMGTFPFVLVHFESGKLDTV